MSMYELTQILWRRRRLIAIVAVIVLVAGTAAVLAGGTRRTYTAKSQVIVEQPVLLGALDGVNVPNKLNAFLPTLCSILDGDAAATQVASQAGVPVGTARSLVHCSPRPNTTIADVRVTTGNAERSRKLTAAAAGVLVDQVHQRYADGPPQNRIDASVLVAAQTPGRDSNHVKTQLALVAVAALLAAIALAVAAEPHRNDSEWASRIDPSQPIVISSNGNTPAYQSSQHGS